MIPPPHTHTVISTNLSDLSDVCSYFVYMFVCVNCDAHEGGGIWEIIRNAELNTRVLLLTACTNALVSGAGVCARYNVIWCWHENLVSYLSQQSPLDYLWKFTLTLWQIDFFFFCVVCNISLANSFLRTLILRIMFYCGEKGHIVVDKICLHASIWMILNRNWISVVLRF